MDETNTQIIQRPEMPVMDTQEIGIAGMTCDQCVKKVDHALRGVQGVKDVQVDLHRARAKVTFDTRQTHIADLHDALERSGYHASAKPPTGAE